MIKMLAIVTVKLTRNPIHNPRNKISGSCQIPRNGLCTDITGSHHSYIEEGRSVAGIRRIAQKRWSHITRIEVLRPNITAQLTIDVLMQYKAILEGKIKLIEPEGVERALRGIEVVIAANKVRL